MRKWKFLDYVITIEEIEGFILRGRLPGKCKSGTRQYYVNEVRIYVGSFFFLNQELSLLYDFLFGQVSSS